MKDGVHLGERSCLDTAGCINPISATVRAGREGIEGSSTCLSNQRQSLSGNGTSVSQQLLSQPQRKAGESIAEGHEKAIVSTHV